MSQAGTVHHKFGEGYSGRNPVPRVQNFEQQQAERHAAANKAPAATASSPPTPPESPVDADVDKDLPPRPAATPAAVESSDPVNKLDTNSGSNNTTQASNNNTNTDSDLHTQLSSPTSSTIHSLKSSVSKQQKQTNGPGPESKAEIMEKANASKIKPTDRLKKNQGERTVRDPVTGRDVVIQDANLSSYDNDALDPAHPKPGPSQQVPDQDANAKHQTPSPVKPGNISFQPYPPTIPTESLNPFLAHMDKLGYMLAVGLGVIWLATAFGRGFFAFGLRTALIGTVAFGGFSAISITRRNLEKELERIRMDLHRVRGEKFSPPTPESVEWLNALLKTVWGLINPDMFISVADMVEDIMQASLPGFIDAVKLSDIGQGTNPVRIIAMRGLPDQPGDKEYPREEWIDQGKPPQKYTAEEEEKMKREGTWVEGNDTDDQSGDYVNMEVALSYQAQPGQSGDALRTSNIHLMIEFFLGLYDWLHIPIPIYAVVEGFAVTARIRLQLVAEAPFIRNMTVTLMGVPSVEVSVTPMSKKLPNVLDLPFISGFVQSSIAAAANEYVAPKSMTLNLAQILMGDGIKKDTVAVGILMIKIRHAKGLSAQDKSGSSDPYVVLAYTKLGKPLYSSRIILSDLNPVFEETAFLLVSSDEINAEEDLSLQLWDSDKRSADDLVGRVVVSLKELMSAPNQIHDREDPLSGFEDADTMPGVISWSIGYFDKAPLNKTLQNAPEDAIKGPAEDIPQDKKEELAPKPTIADTTQEADALTTPPDPEQPSGVLSVIVHYIANLERQDLKGASGDREGAAGQDTDEVTEQSGNLPSAYCEIVLNDDMIYKTRTKQYTSMPFFEAGTERFIRDWTKTSVRVVVRDAKLREHDPILGIVDLPLTSVLTKGSAVTGMYSLVEGVGFGRASVSVLFKSFKVSLPKELRGWDTGTIHILSDVKVTVDPQHASRLEGDQLSIGNTESTRKVSGKLSSEQGSDTISWQIDPSLRLPIYSRYQSAIHFNIGATGLLGNGGPEAFASLWLQDIPDDEEKEIEIPVVVTKKASQLRQNYINDVTAETHEYEKIGVLRCKIMLDSGLDADHEEVADQNQALRHNFEAWEHIEGQSRQAEINSHAMDDGVVDKDEKKAMKRAHERELASRHRGSMQFAPVRTSIWMKDGIKSRLIGLKNKATGKTSRKPTIETEA